MINRYVGLMSVCLVSSYAVSMQKITINRPSELKVLALAVDPAQYTEELKKYDVQPRAVAESAHILLQGNHVPVDINTHVETTAKYNHKQYNKQILQIMHEYYLRHNGQVSFSDQIKADIYTELGRKINAQKSNLNELSQNVHASFGAILYGSTFTAAFVSASILCFIIKAAFSC